MRWPWPNDTREDRAKRIALSYRALIVNLFGGEHPELQALDERWVKHGAGWVRPSLQPLRLDDWLTAGEMADLFSNDPRVYRDWARRGWIRVMVDGNKRRYCVADVVEYSKSRHRRKGACATIGAESPCSETRSR